MAETTTIPQSPDLEDAPKSAGPSGDVIKSLKKSEAKVDPLDWGRPGHLTDAEVKVFVDFQKIVETRGGEFRETVYCFGEEEGEIYALCRWLRARKFVLDDVVKMVEEATECRAEVKKKNFFPDPTEALGVEAYIYISQYPQLYSGHDKHGCPLFISKPGLLNVAGVNQVTTIEGILNYHWYAMMHDFADRLRAKKKEDPEGFTRFECISVLDLEHLSTSAITKLALDIVKVQAHVDSLCFPETLRKMIIINAPRVFSVTWKLVKGWLDPRTISKVEIISSKSSGEKRLRELVDENVLPSDYGGKAEDTHITLIKDAPTGMKRIFTKLFSFRSHDSFVVELKDNESMEAIIFTRAKSGSKFSILDGDSKKVLVEPILVKHTGGDDLKTDPPTRVTIAKDIKGPCKFKIKAESLASRFTTEDFLLVCKIF